MEIKVYTTKICPNCKIVKGFLAEAGEEYKEETCEKCHSKNIDYISRITGYLQAVSGWNEGKKQELLDRIRYGGGGDKVM